MPWRIYGRMAKDDLKAMFAYRVDNAEAPTLCGICKQKHGLGDKN
jgi:hypothetical protein